jgi:hypothetical protein
MIVAPTVELKLAIYLPYSTQPETQIRENAVMATQHRILPNYD